MGLAGIRRSGKYCARDCKVDQNTNAFDNVVNAYVYDIDTIWSLAEGSVSAEGLTLHEAGDEDWFEFYIRPGLPFGHQYCFRRCQQGFGY